MRGLVKRLAAKHESVTFCYEAGPTGYGLHRLIQSMGFECTVVAPSLIPRRPGDQVKTNRRHAIGLACLLRAGEITAVWVPDQGHEAMRDLVRGRSAAVETQRVHRQHITSFMLKHGRIFPRKKAWSMRYLIACGARDRLEGAIPPHRAIPAAGGNRKANDGGLHCYRSRAGRLHVVGRTRCAASLIDHIPPRAQAGAGRDCQ